MEGHAGVALPIFGEMQGVNITVHCKLGIGCFERIHIRNILFRSMPRRPARPPNRPCRDSCRCEKQCAQASGSHQMLYSAVGSHIAHDVRRAAHDDTAMETIVAISGARINAAATFVRGPNVTSMTSLALARMVCDERVHRAAVCGGQFGLGIIHSAHAIEAVIPIGMDRFAQRVDVPRRHRRGFARRRVPRYSAHCANHLRHACCRSTTVTANTSMSGWRSAMRMATASSDAVSVSIIILRFGMIVGKNIRL